MAPSMGGLSDPSAPCSQVHLLSSLPLRQMDRQTADMHVLQIHASFKYVACAQSGKLSLIYSSPGTHKTHKTKLERHPLIILDKVNHKHSLSDGWRVQYTSVECLSWLGLQASGLDLTGRCTRGRFFLHLEAISFLFPLQLQIIQDHTVVLGLNREDAYLSLVLSMVPSKLKFRCQKCGPTISSILALNLAPGGHVALLHLVGVSSSCCSRFYKSVPFMFPVDFPQVSGVMNMSLM